MAQATFNLSDIWCRTIGGDAIYAVGNTARILSSLFAGLLVLQGVRRRIMPPPAVAAVGLLVGAALSVPFAFLDIDPVPEYHDRCWWRSRTQEHVEFVANAVYFCALLGCLCFIHYRKRLRRQEALLLENEDPLLIGNGKGLLESGGFADVENVEEAMPAPKASHDDCRVSDGRRASGHDEEGLQDEAGAAAPAVPLEDSTDESAQKLSLLAFTAMLFLRILCMLFLLGNVNGENSGKAGFTVVLMVASLLVSGFGSFFIFQGGDGSTCEQLSDILKHIAERLLRCCERSQAHTSFITSGTGQATEEE